MKSLNKPLDSLFLEKLEERLETDPISIVAFLQLDEESAEDICFNYKCACDHFQCPELTSCSPIFGTK